VEHCIPVANATDGLELALRSVGVRPGDEVITVANAGGYTMTACRIVGAHPVWVDVTNATLSLDIGCIDEVLGEQTKVVVATHLYGIMVDVEALRTTLDRLGAGHVRIIEDCAQAHGAAMRGRKAGSLGDIGVFSFYPTKNLGALGDAGAVVTNDPKLADGVLKLHQYGWSERFYSEVPMGRNSRMDEIQAAILVTKLPHLERWNAERRQAFRRYKRKLKPPLCVVGPDSDCNVAHLAVVRTPQRDHFRARMAAEGIGTAVHYPVLDCEQISQRSLPGRRFPLRESKRAVQEIVTLPCFPGLTEAELDRIVSTANRIASELI
jgi:dTDP-4-amino-4,6-dideoxygalactose transaminase